MKLRKAVRYAQPSKSFTVTSALGRVSIFEFLHNQVKLGSQATQSRLPLFPQQQTFLRPIVTSEKCHVWTAPAVQEESDISAKRSGAAMYPAFECSRYGRWP